MSDNILRVSPDSDSNGNMLFDQILFLHDALLQAEEQRRLRLENPSMPRVEAVRQSMKSTEWEWAIGDMPKSNIVFSDYAFFAFDEKAKVCVSDMLPISSFLYVGKGYYLLVYADETKNVFWHESGKGVLASSRFVERYKKCGLTGLRFSDQSQPFWKR